MVLNGPLSRPIQLDGVVENFLHAFVGDPEVGASDAGRTVVETSAQDFPTGSVFHPLKPAEGLSERVSSKVLLQSDHGSPFLHKSGDSESRQGIVLSLPTAEEKVVLVGVGVDVVFIERLLDFLVDHEDVCLPRLSFLDGDTVAQLCVEQMLDTKLSEDRLHS